MNSGRVEVNKDGVVTTEHQPLSVKGLVTPGSPNSPRSEVEMRVGTQIDFGRVKVTATVRLECDQRDDLIEHAATVAFTKAVEFMNSAVTLMTEKGDGT